MATILTSLTEQEFEELLKKIVKEIVAGQLQQNPIPKIMDIQDAAKFLKLEVNTPYEKTSKKTIPHYKQGNKLYFDPLELLAWAKSRKVKTIFEVDEQALDYTIEQGHKKAA
jgi:hypothetical protein